MHYTTVKNYQQPPTFQGKLVVMPQVTSGFEHMRLNGDHWPFPEGLPISGDEQAIVSHSGRECYGNRRSIDTHAPAYRALLSVEKPANHEYMDVKANFKRLHTLGHQYLPACFSV